ncbi:MAG: hypothetical protein KDD43_16475, partial [Bdellovibrionales bacterium]|nr:hypothetical protein [Bdellovibrionales bacterium]
MKDRLILFLGANWNKSLYFGLPIILCLTATLFLNFFDYEVPTFLLALDGLLVVGAFAHYTLTQGLLTYVLKRMGEALVVVVVIAT